MEPFTYAEIDLTDELPSTWATDLCFVAGRRSSRRTLIPKSVTSREAPEVRARPLRLVNGEILRKEAPWLFELYETTFLRHARAFAGTEVLTALKDLYAINLNIQWGEGMIYECHVDSNPVQAMLYTATLHPKDGGALVVSHDPSARSIHEVDRDCIKLYPKAGHMLLFDARRHAHYVQPMAEGHARVAVAMNYYTSDCPESARPADLSKHLFGDRTRGG